MITQYFNKFKYVLTLNKKIKLYYKSKNSKFHKLKGHYKSFNYIEFSLHEYSSLDNKKLCYCNNKVDSDNNLNIGKIKSEENETIN